VLSYITEAWLQRLMTAPRYSLPSGWGCRDQEENKKTIQIATLSNSHGNGNTNPSLVVACGCLLNTLL